MAIFSKKTKEAEKKKTSETKSVRAQKTKAVSEDLSRVLLNPRITEKATDKTAAGVYVFDVAVDANKKQVRKAIQQVYKVVPEKVRIARIAYKSVRSPRSGMYGVKGGGKKAYVYLKKGEKITVM
jgi:large subunit ribosomal protein L23